MENKQQTNTIQEIMGRFEEKLPEILGLEADQNGEENMLLTYENGEVVEGVSFKDELEEIKVLFETEIKTLLETVQKDAQKILDDTVAGPENDDFIAAQTMHRGLKELQTKLRSIMGETLQE